MTAAEAFLPYRVAVSNDALYNLKPTSCRGRAYRASIPPLINLVLIHLIQ